MFGGIPSGMFGSGAASSSAQPGDLNNCMVNVGPGAMSQQAMMQMMASQMSQHPNPHMQMLWAQMLQHTPGNMGPIMVPAGLDVPGGSNVPVAVHAKPPEQRSPSSESSPARRRRRRGGGRKKDSKGADDSHENLSTSYRYLGGVHKRNPRVVIPRKLRSGGLFKIDPAFFSMVALAQLSDFSIDLVVYIMTSMGPQTRVCSLDVKTKGELRACLANEAKRTMELYPQRFRNLSPDFSNALTLAVTSGFPLDELPDVERAQVTGHASIPAPLPVPIADAPPRRRLAIENGIEKKVVAQPAAAPAPLAHAASPPTQPLRPPPLPPAQTADIGAFVAPSPAGSDVAPAIEDADVESQRGRKRTRSLAGTDDLEDEDKHKEVEEAMAGYNQTQLQIIMKMAEHASKQFVIID